MPVKLSCAIVPRNKRAWISPFEFPDTLKYLFKSFT